MKVLIIGITGLAGRHLYNQLIENEMYDIYGTYYKNMENVSQFPDAELFRCDVNDINSVESVLEQCKPEWIFHFGAHVTVHNSFNDPISIFQTNVMGTVNVLESIRKINLDCKINLICKFLLFFYAAFMLLEARTPLTAEVFYQNRII